MDSSPSGSIILILILVEVNAFFAGTEMAIVSVNKTRISILADGGNEKAKLLQKLLDEPSKFLATIQVAITFAGFFASASAATKLSGGFASVLKSANIAYSDEISLVIVTVIISYITLVLGELLPKRVALKDAEKISLATVKPIIFISKLAKPFVMLLSWSTNLLVKLLGCDAENSEDRMSKEEIRSIVEVGQEHGVINESEKEMIESIICFDDKMSKEVMTPRTEVFMLSVSDKIENKIDAILTENFSRIPIYEKEIDNIVGILYMKDLFSAIVKNGISNVDIKDIMREPYFVPETKIVENLFKEIQATKNHIAILIDEYGGFSGIVTIEDLIEEVVGDITDEHDAEEPEIEKVNENSYIVNGLLNIDEVNEALNLDLASESADTIGGLIIELLGNIPKSKEETPIVHGNTIFKIEKLDEKRVDKVRISIVS